MSFDLEDWNQLVARGCGAEGWDVPTAAFERQVRVILDLLDELRVQATMFLLGMSVKNYPDLVREVARRGHELASHGWAHQGVYEQTPAGFRRDVARSVELIEKISGQRPRGYRAPAFSINRDCVWALEILCDLGFLYDSSLYDSPKVPRRVRPLPAHPHRLALPSGREIWEFPITVWRVGRLTIPFGGGSYWRLTPTPLLLYVLGRLMRARVVPVTYLHPYECDPERLKPILHGPVPPLQRLKALYKAVRYNARRGRVVHSLRQVAKCFPLVTYEQVLDEADRRFPAGPKTLSREGVLL